LAIKNIFLKVGNFKTDTTILSYGFAVIAIIAALSFFPALLRTIGRIFYIKIIINEQ
jgi:hypothetical protein